MSDLSNNAETLVYDWLFRPAQSPTRPVGLYIALYTAVTDAEAGTGTEVTGGSYARVDVGAAFGASTNGAGSNTGDVTFPTPTADWGNVTHFCIRDASSGGNAVTSVKALTNARNITTGATVKFNAASLTLTVA